MHAAVAAADSSNSNFLVPNGTFIVEVIAFLIMLAILGKYVLPRINKALEDRQEQIQRPVRGQREGPARRGRGARGVQAAAGRRPRGSRPDARGGPRPGCGDHRPDARAGLEPTPSGSRPTRTTQIEAERQQALTSLRSEVGRDGDHAGVPDRRGVAGRPGPAEPRRRPLPRRSRSLISKPIRRRSRSRSRNREERARCRAVAAPRWPWAANGSTPPRRPGARSRWSWPTTCSRSRACSTATPRCGAP